jgi:HD-GYP domain-containing protein (c-di-GMP phosphodiesterase class II)
MERCSGTQFDPDIVRVFLGHTEDYRKLEASAGKAIPR